MSANPNAPAAPRKNFEALIGTQSFRDQLAKALPKHLTPDRFVRILLTATIKTPLLLQCTQETLFKSVYDAASMGLEIDGRRAHLIPYRNKKKSIIEAQLVIDYKGMVELAIRSGAVSSIHADTVHENDEFEVDRGTITKHRIDYRKPRGAPYAVYCLIKLVNGGEKAEIMTQEEVYDIRARSKSADDGPWVTDEKEMWKKTVTKRALKWVPSSPEIRDVFEKDNDFIDVEATEQAKKNNLASLLGAPVDQKAVEPPPRERGEVLKALEALLLERKSSDAQALELVEATTSIPIEKGFALNEQATVVLEAVLEFLATQPKPATS